MNIMIIAVVAFSVIGCGGTADIPATTAGTTTGAATTRTGTTSANATKTSTTIKETKTTTAKTTTTKTTTTRATTTRTTTTTTEGSFDSSPFTKMEGILDDLGIVLYEKKWMYAEAIGAKEGYQYSTKSGTFELYLYDIGSEAYAKALKNKAMDVGGTLFPAIIDDGCALYFYNNVPETVKTKITAAFFQ
jgi:hypothetical protein